MAKKAGNADHFELDRTNLSMKIEKALIYGKYRIKARDKKKGKKTLFNG